MTDRRIDVGVATIHVPEGLAVEVTEVDHDGSLVITITKCLHENPPADVITGICPDCGTHLLGGAA